MSKLLVVVDMQVDFVNGALGTKEAEAIVPAVVKKMKEEIAAGSTVVFTRDTHQDNYPDTQEGRNLPVIHCVEGTAGWQLIPELRDLAEGRKIFNKGTFGSIQLAHYAAANSFDTIELIGLCTDICVISNAMILKAALPEVPVSVCAECCAGVTPESHNNALAAMKMCQIGIV